MQTDHPTTFTYLQYHGGDSWVTPLTAVRMSFYAATGYPTIVFDGVIRQVGAYTNDTTQYNVFTNDYNNRMAAPTDLSLRLSATNDSGDPNSPGPWHVKATLMVEPTGTAKSVRVWILHALDNYPNTGYTDHRDRMCVRPPIPASPYYHLMSLEPGVAQEVTQDFTFDSTSMAHTSDIRIVAFAQLSQNNWPAEIYNAAFLSWPFTPPLITGDLNCDGSVNFLDINPFVLALSNPAQYEIDYPNCDIMAGDINHDGAVDFYDINPFVDLLSGGGG